MALDFLFTYVLRVFLPEGAYKNLSFSYEEEDSIYEVSFFKGAFEEFIKT